MFKAVAQSRAVWQAAKAEEKKQVKIKRKQHELEFLPAAVEVTETPASPVGRAIALLIGLFFVAALAWAWFGHMDTVAVAQGKIIPGDRVKLIQPLESAKVRAILVEDGQQVEEGELLIELDPTESGADRERLRRDLLAARLDIARLTALTSDQENPEAAFLPVADADPDLVAAARALLRDRANEHQENLAALDGEIAQRSAELEMIRASITMLQGTIPLLAERVQAREILAQKEFGSRTSFLELQQELVERRGELAIERHRQQETVAEIDTLKRRRAEEAASFGATARTELIDKLQEAAALEQELRKAEQRYRRQRLVAPVAGTVQQLAVHTIGGVVTPAEPLMVIVPEGSPLEIEAMVLNKDIGFVAAGQPTEIKVESFPFTKYGLISGEVLQVSADAIQDEEQGLVYAAKVAMEQDRILVGDRWVQLTPGMAVTAEVKTGERRLLEYFISPFLEYQHEALRER